MTDVIRVVVFIEVSLIAVWTRSQTRNKLKRNGGHYTSKKLIRKEVVFSSHANLV